MAAALLVGGVAFASPAGASGFTRTATCTASVGQIRADVRFTVAGTNNADGKTVNVTSLSWAFTNARQVVGTRTTALQIGSNNTLKLLSPVKGSVTGIPASGTQSAEGANVPKGTSFKVQAIVDVINASDPSCSISATV